MSSKFIGVAVILFIGLMAWNMHPGQLEFEVGEDLQIPNMLAILLVASLVLERAIEVFLSALRSEKADEKDTELSNLHDNLQQLLAADPTDPAKIQDLRTDLETKNYERTVYSAQSRQIAQWLGLGLGIMIAFVGVRILGNLVTPPAIKAEGYPMFVVVDIFLTGAVLAGGSDAINKIMKLYTGYMDTATKNLKKAADAKT
ncbi:hypothetical protein V5T82_02965 [Magnetovibrio sp. PR-2]|uniref:hypothetical protein n=1 Tax=Magnetovibrio sp. PR-2 TaxID=3120356 RepID=UPI002FCE04B4